jgi:hypothetical protein
VSPGLRAVRWAGGSARTNARGPEPHVLSDGRQSRARRPDSICGELSLSKITTFRAASVGAVSGWLMLA